MRRPMSLWSGISLTLTAALLAFALVTAASVAWFVLVPVGKRAAEDFAALILLSAQTWVELPPATRPLFAREALQTHGLHIHTEMESWPVSRDPEPYLHFLQDSLSRLSGQEIQVLRGTEPHAFAVDLLMGGRLLRFEFTDERIGSSLPSVLVYAMLAGAAAVLVASLLLARRLTEPLQRMGHAAVSVGLGERPRPLAESGPRELAELAAGFNRMAAQVEELLNNRTTLLAGVSHDLRSPLARMSLAVEMLAPGLDAELVEDLRRDIEEMNHLIGDSLQLARGLVADDARTGAVGDIVRTLVEDYRRKQQHLDWQASGDCGQRVPIAALRRVLGNLIDNALRYAGEPVALRCHCSRAGMRVEVLDTGPGIPAQSLESVFQPFHRLESSRSRETGGSGLGLAIVRQICAAHGWRVRLENREGGGLRAVLELPPVAVAEAA